MPSPGSTGCVVLLVPDNIKAQFKDKAWRAKRSGKILTLHASAKVSSPIFFQLVGIFLVQVSIKHCCMGYCVEFA